MAPVSTLSNQDLLEPHVLAAVRQSVLAALQQRPGDARLLHQLVRLQRAIGDLGAADDACAEYLRRHGPQAEVQRLRCLLQGNPGAALPGGGGEAVPFLRLTNVLSVADQAAVWSALEQARDHFAPAVVKWNGGQGVVGEIRQSLRMKTPKSVLDRLLKPLRKAVEEHGLPTAFRLAQPPSGRVESEVVCHTEGGRFGRHTDDAYGAGGRVLTCVYYLHRTPARFTGGDLLLHDPARLDGPQGPIEFTRMAPSDNTALFFPADACHEVRGVHSDVTDPLHGRVSINVWFHGSVAGAIGSERP